MNFAIFCVLDSMDSMDSVGQYGTWYIKLDFAAIYLIHT